MRCTECLTLTLLVLFPISALATSRDRDGQYFCYVEQAAGIRVVTGQAATSGKVTLPQNQMKFFIKIGPVVQNEITRVLCSNTINYFFGEFLEKGIPYEDDPPLSKKFSKNIEDRESIGRHCFASNEVTVTYPGEKHSWILRGYDTVRFFGVEPAHWFNFYGANGDYSFEMGFPYDTGPVVEYGHCTKIEPPK